jgi:DNA-binding LytR/AlgR family response regulator
MEAGRDASLHFLVSPLEFFIQVKKSEIQIINLPNCAEYCKFLFSTINKFKMNSNVKGLKDGTSPATMIENEFFVKPLGSEFRVKVNCADIVWIEANGNKSRIHLKAPASPINVGINILAIENALPHEKFVRIGRSAIINKSFICAYSGNTLCLEGCKQTFDVSKSYRAELFSCFVELK